jgi:hypothetical protein
MWRDASTSIAPSPHTTDGIITGAAVSIFFGCQTFESGKFRSQQADGILGLQEAAHGVGMRSRRSSLPSVVKALVRQHNAANTFSLCLAETSGLLLMGGRLNIRSVLAGGGTIARMVPRASERFTLWLRDVRVGHAHLPLAHGRRTYAPRYTSLGLPYRAYGRALVDSGTSFLYVPTPLWRALVRLLKARAPSLQREGAHPLCALMSPLQRDAMPSLQLLFDGPNGSLPLQIRPAQYMVEYPFPGHTRNRQSRGSHERWYCADVFDNGLGGTVLGASVLREREVVFDMARSIIAFSPADCMRMTAHNSHTKGAFAFAPCSNQTM